MAEAGNTTRIFEKLEALAVGQGRTNEAIEGIVSRLDKMNGSVARSVEKIAALETKEAERSGREKAERSMLSAASPAIWAFVWVVVVTALLNADKLKAALLK